MEDFWTEIKRIVYDGGWKAESLDQLRNRIDYAFKEISMERVHRLDKASYARGDASVAMDLKTNVFFNLHSICSFF